jgi:hypothetical protein
MRAGARLLCQCCSVTDRACQANLDALTRSLDAASRRRLLTSAAGGALGGLVGLRGVVEVAAARTRTASCTAENGFIARRRRSLHPGLHALRRG